MQLCLPLDKLIKITMVYNYLVMALTLSSNQVHPKDLILPLITTSHNNKIPKE